MNKPSSFKTDTDTVMDPHCSPVQLAFSCFTDTHCQPAVALVTAHYLLSFLPLADQIGDRQQRTVSLINLPEGETPDHLEEALHKWLIQRKTRHKRCLRVHIDMLDVGLD